MSNQILVETRGRKRTKDVASKHPHSLRAYFSMIEDAPRDERGRKKEFSLTDCLMSAVAMFGLKYPSILDQGWYEFRCQLEYKQKWRGGKVIAIPPEYTSQECLECHYICKENRKTQRLFQCIACGYTAHAGFVGANNVLAARQAASACGSNLIRGRKQEPAKIREESMLLKFA